MTEITIHCPGPRAGRAVLGLGALILGALSGGPAWGHAIESSLEHISEVNASFRQELELNSRFSTGEPADAAAVRLLRPDGQAVDLGRTDAEGRLRFALPDDAAADWEVQVDAGPGHRDYLELAEAGASPPLASSPSPLGDWRPRAPERRLAQRSSGLRQPVLGGLTVGLGAAGALLLGHRRRR
ncbi:hypothetical protein [Cyanobium sp. ATX 6A2]|uniref:hypothetical protein n=1 Tax=Cyanobium sp. ATX 6A2 TaxID=2823700 RepID=UPI0020CC7457|nr:hypothetical protein [Cyanobium sp. ATX 6A2]